MRFEWATEKAAANLAKHGVAFEEARTVFADPLGRIVDDERHSEDKQRFVLMGHSEKQRLLADMFTDRGEAIRLISARVATCRERREYEEG
ncbi:MAG: BrnT family toxin [Candidatus Schekmanbacteria bacterium]|nr:BrnT family toxin [Candidatus Schekmanbacteria bacterium]